MKISARCFGGKNDLLKLLDFSIKAWSIVGQGRYLHLGDLVWRMYRSASFNPQQNIRLWEDLHQNLQGFVWYYPQMNAFDLQIHPQAVSSQLAQAMLGWAEHRALKSDDADSRPDKIHTAAFDNDSGKIETLKAHGYQPEESYYGYLVRRLDQPPIPPALPQGFSIRSVVGPDDLAQRVALDQALGTGRTLPGYRQLMAAPQYHTDLDLVSVAPNGEFAACCICWADSTNRIGEIEPVATLASYRRLGLAKSIVSEGLTRLRAKGMDYAFLYCSPTNEAAWHLYQNLGFEMLMCDRDYSKKL